MRYQEFAILWGVTRRLETMRANTNGATVRAVLGDPDDPQDGDALAQAALDRAVEGEYLAAIILEEAAKFKLTGGLP